MRHERSAGGAAEPAMDSEAGKWATSEDWDKHRDEITSLYKAGNKTLKEVSQHMVKNHDFHATLRMYKRRLSQWNVQKNVKAGEVLAVLRSKEYIPGADPEQRPQVVKVNGRDVPVDKVEQYLDRRRRQLQLMRKKGILDTRGQVSVPPQHPFSAPDHLQVPEEMGRLIQQYIDGSFGAGAWIPGENRDDLRSCRSDGSVVYLFSNLFDACSHLRQNEIQAGFSKINQSLDLMDRALSEEDPRFLVSVFRVLALCHWYNLPDIYRMLLTHLKRLSGIVLGPGHPTSRILVLLSSMTPGERDMGVKVAAELLCRHLQRYVVRTSNSGAYLHLVVSYVDTLESLGLYEESVQGIVEAMRYPDPRFKWSAATLDLYFKFILRPADNRSHAFPPPTTTEGGSPVCPPPNFVRGGEQVGPFGQTASLDEANDAAVEIMRYCYTLRAKALAEGRTTHMTKGGASMWPSLVTCPDEERRRILTDLLVEREMAELEQVQQQQQCGQTAAPTTTTTELDPSPRCGAPAPSIADGKLPIGIPMNRAVAKGVIHTPVACTTSTEGAFKTLTHRMITAGHHTHHIHVHSGIRPTTASASTNTTTTSPAVAAVVGKSAMGPGSTTSNSFQALGHESFHSNHVHVAPDTTHGTAIASKPRTVRW